MEETSFSVEVLGFPDSDVGSVVPSVATFFGIGEEDARRIVEKAPIKVKRNASPPATEALVKQLLELGADVRVINEQTEDQKTYRASDRSVPPPREIAPVSIEAPASLDPTSGLEGRVSGAAMLAQAIASRRGRDVGGPRPQPAPQQAPPPEPEASTSVPPPGDDKDRKSLEPCASCTRTTEKGEVCQRCGWDSSVKKRVCRQCKGELDLTSTVAARPLVAAFVLLPALVVAAPLFLFFGFLPAAALVVLAAGAVLAIDARSLRYTCKACKLDVMMKLEKGEQRRLRSARVKSAAGALPLVLAAAGMLALAPWGSQALSQSSFGLGWNLGLPPGKLALAHDLRTVKIAGSPRQILVLSGHRAYVGGATYWLMHAALDTQAPLPKPELEEAAKAIIAAVFNGTAGAVSDASGAESKSGIDVKLTGSANGKPVKGVLRALAYDRDVVFVAVTNAQEDPETKAALASLSVVHGN